MHKTSTSVRMRWCQTLPEHPQCSYSIHRQAMATVISWYFHQYFSQWITLYQRCQLLIANGGRRHARPEHVRPFDKRATSHSVQPVIHRAVAGLHSILTHSTRLWKCRNTAFSSCLWFAEWTSVQQPVISLCVPFQADLWLKLCLFTHQSSNGGCDYCHFMSCVPPQGFLTTRERERELVWGLCFQFV